MIQLHTEQCELTYEGAFVKPAFALTDCPGKVSELLLDALQGFGCTGADLTLEEGELGERGVACQVDELNVRVAIYGDRVEVSCTTFIAASTSAICTVLENVWPRLTKFHASASAKTHSFLFEADTRVEQASYQEILNHVARPPESLPAGTETAIVYYFPAEPSKGYAESSLVLNRSQIDDGLQVNATLVYEAESKNPAAALQAANDRLRELLGNLGFEWID
ncbi:MAG: hypothetical protein ACLP59_00430 [Bryobacteraceae bacterium]